MLIGEFAISYMLPIAGQLSQDNTAIKITSIIGQSLSTILFIFAIPGLICSYGLFTKKSWSRILALILSCISLLSIPIGTIVGAYGLWILFKDETKLILSNTNLNNNNNPSSE